jgi:hypothetical protein
MPGAYYALAMHIQNRWDITNLRIGLDISAGKVLILRVLPYSKVSLERFSVITPCHFRAVLCNCKVKIQQGEY